jgi:DNA-binding XRE family transcriptional regulator
MKLSGWWHIRNLISNPWRWKVKRTTERIPIDELVDNFGAVVNKARHTAGLSGRELARRVDVAATTIFRIESGEQPPGAQIMARLLQVLYDGNLPRVRGPKIRAKLSKCPECGMYVLPFSNNCLPSCVTGLVKNANKLVKNAKKS